MNVLVIATKAPWPPVDGGRLLLLNTLEGLAAAGCRATLVAPVDPEAFDLPDVAAALQRICAPRLVRAAPAGPLSTLLRVLRRRSPWSIARHALPAVRREVEKALAERVDVVHVEQLQALSQAAPAVHRGIPVVLREQNVESDLWRETALRTGGWRGRLLAREALLLARWEGEAVRRCDATLALTREDAARLEELSEDGWGITVLPAPFPILPAASGDPLPGEPAVVLLGSRGWRPNEDSAEWFLSTAWPAVASAFPRAKLHLFGAGPPGPLPPAVELHPAPADSGEAFRPGSVLAVPLRIASGVRMKVLEAWARGVPVVGTPAALAGLAAVDGSEALIAADAPGFAAALLRLEQEPGLAGRLVEGGRRALRERHDPGRVAAELVACYERLIRESQRT